jgi:hypothetical protein
MVLIRQMKVLYESMSTIATEAEKPQPKHRIQPGILSFRAHLVAVLLRNVANTCRP